MPTRWVAPSPIDPSCPTLHAVRGWPHAPGNCPQTGTAGEGSLPLIRSWSGRRHSLAYASSSCGRSAPC